MSKKDEKMSLVGHLSELRKRLTIIAVVNLIASILCYQFVDIIMKYILILGKGMNLVYISPSELFLVYIKVAFTCGIIISSPITLVQIWQFVSKGLYKKEKIYIVISLLFGIIFFFGGAYFCYKVVLPTTVNFFVKIAIPGVRPMISIASFVSFMSTMLICFGVIFEMPIVVFLLSLTGLVKPKMLLDKQPIFIVAIFIVAALITPPDVVSQMFLGIPMVLLFEFSIGVSFIVNFIKDKKRKRLEAEH